MPTPAGPRLFLEANMTEVQPLETIRGEAVAFSMRSPSKFTANEDAAGFFPLGPSRAVLVVADGLGGHAAGAKASATAIRVLQQSIDSAITEADPNLRAAILDGMEQANKAVMAIGNGAATTMSVVELDGDEVRSYHVGDSVFMLFGQRRKLKFLTVAHSPVGFALEAGLMDEKEAMHHEYRHIVSNVIGSPDMRIEIGSSLTLSAKDTIVVASDGLADNLRTGQVVARMATGPLAKAAQTLADDAKQRMMDPQDGQPSKADDMTFLVYRPGLSPKPAAEGPSQPL